MNMQNLRSDFPILKEQVNGFSVAYLDNAATTQKPLTVLDALQSYYTTSNANVHRSVHTLAERATGCYEGARATVAQFINSRPHEIIFTKGTTEAINTVAYSWAQRQLKPGDTIVLTQLEHHANLLIWQQLAQRMSLHIQFIPIVSDGLLDMKIAKDLIEQRPKLLSVIHTSHVLGNTVDVETLIEWSRKSGTRVLVDAAQSIAHRNIDVQYMKPDFLVFSGHKMLGPTGIGVLYIASDVHDEIGLFEVGGGVVERVDFDQAVYLPLPMRLEAGTPPIAQAYGLAAAINYLVQNVSFDVLRDHESALCARLINGLQKINSVEILGPLEEVKRSGHLVSFRVSGVHAHDVATFLDQCCGVAVRAGHHCAQPLLSLFGGQPTVRASFYLYNIAEEVDRLIDGVSQAVVALAR